MSVVSTQPVDAIGEIIVYKFKHNPLGVIYEIVATLYLILMGYTSTGVIGSSAIRWYLLGDSTYNLANILFYLGMYVLVLRIVIGLMLRYTR